MEYKQLNLSNRKKMNGICKSDIEMQWEDTELLNILLGTLPRVRRTIDDKKVEKQIWRLEKILKSYDVFTSERESFINEVNDIVKGIRKEIPYWHGVDTFEVQKCIDMQKFCLISGEGGIGKSYFVKCLEEELERQSIEHLCIYGKFEKNVEIIDESEIVKVAKEKDFVFVIDAINEMPVQTQRDLLEMLERLKVIRGIRIIVTYRTGTMQQEIVCQLEKIAQYLYRFPGVSYESALKQLSQIPIADVYKYDDILYSNNPMLLNMLCRVLQEEKIVEQTINSVSSITHILEQYIKFGLKDVVLWRATKRVVDWMYENNKKWIEKSALIKIVADSNAYIEKMQQQGFLVVRVGEEETYSFAIETLTDFLLARNIWNEFDKEKLTESIEKLKEKLKQLYGIEEVVILALFDKYTPDYELIKKILVETKLLERFDYDTLLKIRFKRENIDTFLQYFAPSDKTELLLHFGGYIDKPFNCVNYMNNYYFEDEERQLKELSSALSGRYIRGRVKERLKNILYFINVRDGGEKRLEEAFYFALWCCAAPNKDVRCLAMKLLYDVVSQEQNYKSILETSYSLIKDEYIKEAIIYVICVSANMKESDRRFLEAIVQDKNYLYAKSLKRIAKALGKDYDYINWEKEDKFIYTCEAGISKNLSRLFYHVDLREKELLNFRYWGPEHIDIHNQFLRIDKREISEWNKYLKDSFSCVRTGECNGSFGFEKNVETYCDKNYRDKVLDINSFMCSFEVVIKDVFEMYGAIYNAEDRAKRGETEFENSVFKKSIVIAQEIFYGSMMCNYYTNEFATYNNFQNSIGYEVYDPIEYEEEIRIATPIPVFQTQVEELGDIIVSRMILPKEDVDSWIYDAAITEENLMQLLKPIEKDGKEWVMIAGRLFMHDGESSNHSWQENYDYWCCTSNELQIDGTMEDRYLTIELKEYRGNMQEYIECSEYPYLCKDTPMITSNSDVFEETRLVLPPSELIRNLNLSVSISDMTWRNVEGEIIIYCNNNKHSYYKDFVGGTVFMRKDVYDDYIKEHDIKFFAFSEKWTPTTGYADETAFHFEIKDGEIVRKYYNYLKNSTSKDEGATSCCDECPYGFEKREYGENQLSKFLKNYGIDFEDDDDEL